MVPAAIGGAAGLVVGAAIIELLALDGLDNLPHAADARMNAVTMVFVAAVAAVVGLVIGVVPTTTAGTWRINEVLGDASRSGTAGRAARLLRRVLVVTQVAVSLVLLIGATLLFTSFRHLLALDGGFAPDGVVTATIFPPPSRYPDEQAVIRLLDRLRERARQIPGVTAAGFTSNIALSGFESPSTVSAADRTAPDAQPLVPSIVVATPGYFEAMSTPLVRGRYFTDADRESAARVAIVDEHLARRLWPDQDPIGKAILRGEFGPSTIVGVVREVRLERLAGSIDAIGTAYFPHAQAPPTRRLRWIAIKSVADSAAVVRELQAAVAEIDPDLPIADVQTMNERTSRSLVPHRLATNLATMFAAVALLLSMLGIYGVVTMLVARRTREIGIRMALGSTARRVLRLVLTEALVLIGAGVLLGLGGALAMAQALTGLVFGVRPTEPLLFALAALATACAALLACIAPAQRAARVNPVDVLSVP
jgi:predicted permease